jgi:cytochrome P450
MAVQSEASDLVDRSQLRGFLSKYVPSEFDATKGTLAYHDKFIIPKFSRMKEGNGAGELLHHKNPIKHGLAAHPQDSMSLSSTREEPLIDTKDFDLQKIAGKREENAMQELLSNDNSRPITLSAIGIGFLTMVAMLVIRIRNRMQPATVLASSAAFESDMSMNLVPGLDDNIMEMKSQVSNINGEAALDSRTQTKKKSSRGGLGQLASRDSLPLTVCYATATEQDEATAAKNESMLYNVKTLTAEKDSSGEEGLPWWWDGLWSLPFTYSGETGTELTLGDTMRVFKGNIEQIYGDAPSADGAPLAEGDISGLADGTLYLGLHEYAQRFGPVYKLCFGPKSFIVISDAAVARHVLAANNAGYNKGVLAEILEDIMGKGLIPADPVTWKTRKRAIVPAFHKRWLDRMCTMFANKTDALIDKLETGKTVDLEERFGSLALDIIGSAVFNYEFESVATPSEVVQAAIDTLREAEHRSMIPAPYWKIPGAMQLVPRQRAFTRNMALLNDQLNKAIAAAVSDRTEMDTEALQDDRDYDAIANPSLLRFLVDQRGEEATDSQLRDDLMTMLIAGHETTASALTWCVFELAQKPELLEELRAELDTVLPDGRAPRTRADVEKLELTRLTIAESLRMYPQPPLLIRRAVDEDTLPEVQFPDSPDLSADFNHQQISVTMPRASDVFIAIYSLHRSPKYWKNPDDFNPKRWLEKSSCSDDPTWAGYDPEKWRGATLYPTEASADFAFLPFGGGARKCVGDQFAMIEATVALAGFIRNYDFSFAGKTDTPDKVGTNTGATIHTRNGLWMTVTRREGSSH